MVRNSFWILLAVLFYTLMAVSAKLCSEFYNPFEIVFYRAMAGAAFMAILMKAKGISFSTKYPFSHVLRCVMGTSCFIFEILALRQLPISVAQTIDYSSPLIFAMFLLTASFFSKDEKFEFPILGAILVGFSGVLLIFRPTGETNISLVGAAFGLTAAFCGASASWFIRSLGKQRESTERTVFYFMCSGIVIGGIGSLIWPGGFHTPHLSLRETVPLLCLMFSGLFAQILWTYAWERGHPLLNSVFQFSGILYGAAIGVLFFEEAIDAPEAIGMLLVLAAGLFASLYLNHRKQKKTAA